MDDGETDSVARASNMASLSAAGAPTAGAAAGASVCTAAVAAAVTGASAAEAGGHRAFCGACIGDAGGGGGGGCCCDCSSVGSSSPPVGSSTLTSSSSRSAMLLPCRNNGAVCQIALGKPCNASSTGCSINRSTLVVGSGRRRSEGRASIASSRKSLAASFLPKGFTGIVTSPGTFKAVWQVHTTCRCCVESNLESNVGMRSGLFRYAASHLSSTKRPFQWRNAFVT